MQMVALGIDSCSNIDILTSLQKQRQTVDQFEVDVDADRVTDEVPAVFTSLHAHYRVEGDVRADKSRPSGCWPDRLLAAVPHRSVRENSSEGLDRVQVDPLLGRVEAFPLWAQDHGVRSGVRQDGRIGPERLSGVRRWGA